MPSSLDYFELLGRSPTRRPLTRLRCDRPPLKGASSDLLDLQNPGFEDPHPRAKRVDRRRRTMMEHNTILYISDRANSSYSVFAALKETGCEVVSTNSPTQGVALLYIMRTVTAVVLDNRAREQASFDLVQSLSQIRPDVPIMLLCGDQSESSSSWTDGCVSTDELTSVLHHLFTAEAVA
jgi:CheY-like chemotaxis protein